MKLARRSRQRGQGIIEFAVIFPIFAIILFAVIDGGLLMGRYNNINNGAKEGARLGAVGAPEADILTRVKAQAHGELDSATGCGTFSSTKNEVCIQWITGAGGEAPGRVGSSVRVIAKYHYPFLTPIVNWIGSGWTIEACAVQRLERPVNSPPNTSTDTACTAASGGGPSPTATLPPGATATGTAVGPTNTPAPSSTPGSGATNTPAPTATRTPVPPTATAVPCSPPTAQRCKQTATAIAQTATATP